jgi:hypothetical protein
MVRGQSVDDLVPGIMSIVFPEDIGRSVVSASFVDSFIEDHQFKASLTEGSILQPAIP